MPRGQPLTWTFQFKTEGPAGDWRGAATLVLSDNDDCDLGEVPCALTSAWAGGLVVADEAIDLAGYGSLVTLEVVDGAGAPAAATLAWRSSSGAGSAALKAAPTHSVLPPVAWTHELTVSRRPPREAARVTATTGSVRVVVDG
ncbi:MAG: hypothetical protein R3F49_13650 [Planctomycetota bacterium]